MGSSLVRILWHRGLLRTVRMVAWSIVLRPYETSDLKVERADVLAQKIEIADHLPFTVIERQRQMKRIGLLAERIDALDVEIWRRGGQ